MAPAFPPWTPRRLARAGLAVLTVCLAGCQQEMARQPYYRPLRESPLFADGRSARPLVPGTVPRGAQEPSGTRSVESGDWLQLLSPSGHAVLAPDGSIYVDAFPQPVTLQTLKRGQERFDIYCAVCHDRVGTGKGMIVLRGFTPPPSYVTDESRGLKLRGIHMKLPDVPVGYYFEVITNGFGAMPDYAGQVPPDDRWAIIAYIRALQLSQHATLADVRDPAEKAKLLKTRGNQP
jgi:mono/diheme cytochrome c family protein